MELKPGNAEPQLGHGTKENAELGLGAPGTVPHGYKQTEVGVIPEDWDVQTLGDIANFLSGGTPSRSNDNYWTGNIPWISATSLRRFFICISDSNVTKEAVAAGSKMAPIGSTLLLVRGSALHKEILSGLVTKPVCFNQDVKALVPSGQVVPIFLTFLMLGKGDDLLKLVSSAGNTAGVLDTKLLKAFVIHLPPIAEQEAIAEALSDADALVDSLEQLIAKKRQIKQGAMQDLLTGMKRLPGFEGEWEVTRLGDAATLKARIGWQGLTTAEYLKGGSYFLVTGTDFKNGYIDWANCHYVSEKRYRQDKHIQLRSHDVLVTKDGTIGKVALVPDVPKPTTLNSGVFVIRPIEQAFHPEFFYYLLCSRVFTDFLSQLSAGSTINHLYQKDFVSFTYETPSTIDEQTAIAAILSDMDAEIAALEAKLAKARQLKQGMMQELLTGKTRLI